MPARRIAERMAAWPAEAPEAAEASRASSTRPLSVQSFEELYQQHFDFVWKCARAFGTMPQEIDDVVQDVFMVIQRRFGDLREDAVLRSWIYGITRRVVSSHRRRRRERESRAPEHVDVDALTSSELSPLAATEHSMQVQLLSTLLERLDERKREVFVLSEILEMNGREIAETLGVPMNTVYSRLRAAREEFDAAVLRQRKSMEHGRRP